ncbi:MAG: AI-2E family transporter [Pseudonocardia sp.]|nr:AI-2E family transporter [Pseudonocardia sp.]
MADDGETAQQAACAGPRRHDDTPAAAPPAPVEGRRRGPRETVHPLLRIGRFAWALLGIAGVFVLAWLVATRLAVVVVPLLLALFPAALLAPAVGLLHRHRVPRALATLLAVLVAAAAVASVFAFIVPAFLAQLPELSQSLTQAGSRLDTLIHRLPSVEPSATLSGLVRQAVVTFFGGINAVLLAAFEIVFGLLLVLVVLVCYLAGGARIVGTGVTLLPLRYRAGGAELVDRVWCTLGSYIRALFLVALFDATSMGIGLWLLGVPLVLPLSVLVFFGAFVPYIGAFLSGLFAVLVAFAEAGLGAALAVLALIVVVQQVDGNVVQPLLMGAVTRLSAFTVIVAVAAGAALLGVLGAFLAVPTAACVAQVVAFARERGLLPPRRQRPGVSAEGRPGRAAR